MDGLIVFLIIVALIALLAGAVKLGHNKGKTGSFIGGSGGDPPTHLK